MHLIHYIALHGTELPLHSFFRLNDSLIIPDDEGKEVLPETERALLFNGQPSWQIASDDTKTYTIESASALIHINVQCAQ